MRHLPKNVYHLAEAANWPSIRRDGLLSATRLIAAAGLPDRDARTHRTQHTQLPNGVHIRDQCPMPPAALEKCLCGLLPADWYAIINARVFFWFDPERLNRQRAACSRRPQVVLVVDAHSLIVVHAQRAALTPINTGNARRRPARRGVATFVPYAQWQRSGWQSEADALGTLTRKRSHRPVELTVPDAVPDIARHVVAVVELAAGKPFVMAARPSA